MIKKNAPDSSMVIYCILDSDYRLDETLEERRKEAPAAGINLHIWSRKELENYLIVPSAILRIIETNMRREVPSPTIDEVEEAIFKACDTLKNDTIDAISEEYHQRNKAHSVGKGNEFARSRVEASWATLESRVEIVSGKLLVSAVAKWSQENFGAGFGIRLLARELRRDELAPEVVDVLTAIEEKKAFPASR